MTYSYRNNALIDLPLRMAQHDVANLRTLDVSGNGYHATLGDGSTPATYPTKTGYRRGYTFDGSDYLMTGAVTIPSTTGCTLGCMIDNQDITATDYLVAVASASLADVFGIIFLISNQYRFYCGGVGLGAAAVYPALDGMTTIIGTHNGTNTSIYVNGQIGTDAGTPAPPDLTGTQFFIAGRSPAGGSFYSGSILDALVLPYGVSPIQAADLHNLMMKKVNDV